MSGNTVYPAFIVRLCQANIERPVSTKETKKCVTRISTAQTYQNIPIYHLKI